jgi:hypothetical protein
MQITLLGVVLVPLSLIWALQPLRLLQLALVASVFEAAAAMVFGSFGLQPAMVPGVLFMAYMFAQYALGMRYPGEGTALRATLPLLALLGYALLSAWLLPDMFAGHVMVWPQRGDALGATTVPLEPTPGNVTQSLYLTLNVGFTVAVAVFMTRAAIPYRSIIAAYLLGGYIVVGLALWQFANRNAGVPFPDDLLHSNPGWAIVEQSFGSVPRIQGPFSEPAALAGYMSGIVLCCLWLSLRGYQVMRPNLLLSLALLTTLLSTSTTGIVMMVVGVPTVLGMASIGGDRGAIGRIGKTLGYLMLGGAIVILPIFVLKPSLMDAVATVVEATLNKGDSDSFTERTSADTTAIETLDQTYGLGVGWGSYRSSSLIPGLLANSGVFGLAMVFWLILRVIRFGARGRRAAPRHPGRILVDGFTTSLCTTFGSALIAGPTISSLAFYLQLGCVIGVLSRMIIEARPRSTQLGAAIQLGFAVAGNAQSIGTNDAGQPKAKDRDRTGHETDMEGHSSLRRVPSAAGPGQYNGLLER